MRSVTFEVPGDPASQKRPRFARIGAHVRTYDPKDSRAAKGVVRQYAEQAMDGGHLLEGPLQVTVIAWFPCPKTDCRKRDPRPLRRHAKKPDADNVAKLVKDAIKGVVYGDDSQVARLLVEKWICPQEDNGPRTFVAVTEIEETPEVAR